jgi:hypothetical protein
MLKFEWDVAKAQSNLAKHVPAPIIWTRFCNSGRLSHGISLTGFEG